MRHPATQRKLWNNIFKQYKKNIKILQDYYLFSAISGYFIRNYYDSDESVIYEQLELFNELPFKIEKISTSDIISNEEKEPEEIAIEESPKTKKTRKKKL